MLKIDRNDESFRKWLGGRDAIFNSVNAVQRRKWLFEYEQSLSAQITPAEKLTHELETKYGTVSAAPALERSKHARLQGNDAIAPAPTLPNEAARLLLASVTGEKKLAYHQAFQESVSLRGIASRGGAEGAAAERKLASLRARFPAALIG